jgi:hypothetical protein
LDIVLFADEYDFVFWMDADTITISNFDFFFKEVHAICKALLFAYFTVPETNSQILVHRRSCDGRPQIL